MNFLTPGYYEVIKTLSQENVDLKEESAHTCQRGREEEKMTKRDKYTQ